MLRWLRRHFATEVVVVWRHRRPVAWAIGWAEPMQDGSGWCSYVERIYVRPPYRGRSLRVLYELHRKWMERSERLGYVCAITKIDVNKPELLKAGARWAGYRPYAVEGGYVWCFLGRPVSS